NLFTQYKLNRVVTESIHPNNITFPIGHSINPPSFLTTKRFYYDKKSVMHYKKESKRTKKILLDLLKTPLDMIDSLTIGKAIKEIGFDKQKAIILDLAFLTLRVDVFFEVYSSRQSNLSEIIR